MTVLPGVVDLSFAALEGHEDVSSVPALVPDVRNVVLQTAPGARFDIAPFAALFPDAEITLDER
ncbi:hypothetical protein ACIQ1J_06875 [Streptomyces sp. NPDC097107]|uniref:hypothetical protein n=1 Tax=Streptomyces sp. NPDC097107 TaxID=3366089 RepID=UPI00380D2143